MAKKNQTKKAKTTLTKKGVLDRTKTGSELANIRWAKATTEERYAQGYMLGTAAWAKVPAKERSAIMTALAKRPRPNARLPEYLRCPCGIMSLDRAKKRNHICKKPKSRSRPLDRRARLVPR
jgi:hypothetical protein